MELVARKADLVRELQFFQQIVERKNTIPILANVLIETEGNAIKLLATDIDTNVLETARRGLYNAEAVQGLAPEQRRYFLRIVTP